VTGKDLVALDAEVLAAPLDARVIRDLAQRDIGFIADDGNRDSVTIEANRRLDTRD
jgi:hypothetical protein